MMLLAQQLASFDLIHFIVIAIVVAGVIGIALVVVRQAGIVIPAFVLTIFWICLAVFVAIVAIKFLAGMI